MRCLNLLCRTSGCARGRTLVTAVSLSWLLPMSAAKAQEAKITPSDLRAPSSPAFVLFGIEPTAVERPNSPRALAATILSNTSISDLIPRNVALEVAPYWLASHPTLTFDDYYNANVGQSLLQSLSLSMATTTLEVDSLGNVGTGVGFGFRTMILGGRPSQGLKASREALVIIQDSILDADSEAEEDRLAEKARALAIEIQQHDRRRIGLKLELAGAFAATFPTSNFDDGKVTRIGGWVTLGYRLPSPQFEFLLVERVIINREPADAGDFLDIGGRMLFEPKDLSLSFEFVKRLLVNQPDEPALSPLEGSYRVSGYIEYRVSN
ncbi:MAG: hypothetical protein JSW51_05270, partial [Gemmatimonadota bacterium]